MSDDPDLDVDAYATARLVSPLGDGPPPTPPTRRRRTRTKDKTPPPSPGTVAQHDPADRGELDPQAGEPG